MLRSWEILRLNFKSKGGRICKELKRRNLLLLKDKSPKNRYLMMRTTRTLISQPRKRSCKPNQLGICKPKLRSCQRSKILLRKCQGARAKVASRYLLRCLIQSKNISERQRHETKIMLQAAPPEISSMNQESQSATDNKINFSLPKKAMTIRLTTLGNHQRVVTIYLSSER